MRRADVAIAFWIASTLASPALAQPLRAADAAKAAVIANDQELARLKSAPNAELNKLRSEQEAACRANARSAECAAKSDRLNKARLALEGKINWVSKHEIDARKGALVKPNGVAVPPATSGTNCKSCHAGASAAPASDPIPPPSNPPPSSSGISSGTSPDLPGGQGKSCFIATAAFGSPYDEEVVALRRFRDEKMAATRAGKWAIDVYYQYSPPIAEAISDRPTIKAIVRTMLRAVVLAIERPASAATLVMAMLALCLTLFRWCFAMLLRRKSDARPLVPS